MTEVYGNDAVFESAAIGRVMLVAETDPTPPLWHDCDGSLQASFRWPDFVKQMGIQNATFTLIKPERQPEGKRYIIKMGSRVED
jgi:hypothetical protein